MILLAGCVFLLNSCFLKSIQAFYIDEATVYKEDFLGNWKDNDKGTWEINSFASVYKKEFVTSGKKLNAEEQKIYDTYKKAYVIEHEHKGKSAIFVGMLFTVNGKLFADFTPFYGGFENENKLLGQHVVTTHSIAKVEQLADQKIRFKWLDEARIEELLINEKLQIQHEKRGVDGDIVLTATSDELYKFLEKFEASNGDDVWGTSDQITLESVKTKP